MSIRAFLVCFLDRKTYYEKLSKLFVEDQNFEKVINYDHEIDFKNYNKLLNETLGRSLNKKTLRSLEANHSISSAFGLIKLHKPEKDLRPIITGYNSMVDNAHEFLKKLIEPIAKKCSFLINCPHMFQEKFQPKCKNFDSDKYEILSFDATKLYTSVNTNRVISEIFKIIYKNPTDYFKDKDENGRWVR